MYGDSSFFAREEGRLGSREPLPPENAISVATLPIAASAEASSSASDSERAATAR